jgi:photosystem II stability/assembly factor-like uncharacterized protein
MQQRDRNAIRYDQFVKPRRRRWPWVLLLVVIVLAALAAAAFAWMDMPTERPSPPPALSKAGGPVANESYRWKAVAVGGGGYISGISIDRTGKTMVARTDVYGAYIWDAGANVWKQLITAGAFPAADRMQDGIADGVYEIVVADSDPTRIYMAVKGKVYRSDDRGASFVLASAGNPFPLTWNANSEYRADGPYMAVDPVDPNLVLLGTPENGLWRSANAGASWARVASVPASIDRLPAPGMQAPGATLWFERAALGKPTGRIFAMASGRGMFVSSDRGVTFSPLASSTAHPLALHRGVFDRNGVFFGVDGLAKTVWSYRDGRWHNLTSESGLESKDFVTIAANPRSDQIILFDRGGAGYQSTDVGKSWSHVSHSASVGAGDPPWLKTSDEAFFTTGHVLFDPVIPNQLWVAAGAGIYHADMPPGNSVAAWVSQTRGIEELVTNDVIQAPGQSPVFAAWDFGIHVKNDLNAYSTTFQPNERGLIAAQQLDWTPADPGVVVTNASDTRMGCCSEDGNSVMAGYSRDGGRHWSKFAMLPTPPGTKPEDPWRMSFGTIAVASNDPENIVWEPAFNRTPFYTRNNGRSWDPVRLPDAIGDNPGSFEHHWYQRKTLTADKTAPSTFYLYHSGDAPNPGLLGLWRTTDGGAGWQRMFSGEIAPASNMAAKLRSVPGHAGHLFFTSAFAYISDTVLRRSVDGGATWTEVPEVTRVDDVAFGKAAPGASYPAIFVSGRVGGVYGIWRSVDDAASWHRLVDFPVGTLDQVTVVGADPDVFGRVYVGYKGSGWIWGEPAVCTAAPYRSLATTQCSSVGR